MYNLKYYIGKKFVETVCSNKPKAICNFIKRQKQTTTHRLGKLKLELV